MRTSLRRRALALTFGLIVAAIPLATATAQGPESGLELDAANQPVMIGAADAAKARTSALAQTDPELLERDDDEPVNVLIKLDYDSAATYSGDIAGLAATSPAVTGRPLSGRSDAERTYDRFARAREREAVNDLERAVPAAEVGRSLRIVYGGVAAVVPANSVEDILDIPGVVAVQQDALNQLLTDASTDFINAPPVYNALGGPANAGAGVIYGNLDSGVWPEHPSFADLGHLAAPPPKADGTPRTCDYGDNPLTPANDPFVCQNKLIGGEAFLDAYLSDPSRAADETFHNTRDSNGHGTHTAATSAGNRVASAPILGIDRGPIQGVAPGAWIIEYKVCGSLGCFSSDSAAAVQQAILDGVDVINFSISGGTEPFTDPVELAFLDAYAAGVFVSASAGNSGPTAGTVNHVSPWVTTVAASTQTRQFQSTMTVTNSAGTQTFTGSTITSGLSTPLPVVLASAPPYNNALCSTPAPPGLFTGKIVACERSVTRALRGFNVRQGGAAGMVLYNATPADTMTDTHWLPTIHIGDGPALLSFLASGSTPTASFTAGTKTNGQSDTVTAFSSRGPAGLFVKPDVTAPGIQIVSAHTPVRENVNLGPQGEMFQSIGGTSMSSPHVAGAALLVKALHPTWTPGQIKSALMTSAVKDILKHDRVTPADPFDVGSGRIDVGAAGAATLLLDESPQRFFALGNDPLSSVHLNLPSIRASVAGRVTTTREVTNPGRQTLHYDVSAIAPAGSSISVSPSRFNIAGGGSRTITVTIDTTATSGTHFGRVDLTPSSGSAGTPLHLPVAFTAAPGSVKVSSSCDPATVSRGSTTTCVVTATNEGSSAAEYQLHTRLSNELRLASVSGATATDSWNVERTGTLAGRAEGVPTMAPGASPAGFIPLSAFGITPVPVGDETLVNFNVPSFRYNNVMYNRVGADSNGVLHIGGGEATSVRFNPPAGPSPDVPNNIVTAFWTDMDGTGAPGIYAATLTDGITTWLVIEHRVARYGTTNIRPFQTWIEVGGVEHITFTYDPGAPQTDPAMPYLVGAENGIGAGDMRQILPTTDLRVTGGTASEGESVSYSMTVRGQRAGNASVTTRLSASTVLGDTFSVTPVTVTP